MSRRNSKPKKPIVQPASEHWVEAVRQILKYQVGEVIRIKDLEAWLGASFEDRDFALRFLEAKTDLLWNHDLLLSRVPGEGYTISTDEQAVNEHLNRCWKRIRSAINRAGKIASIVDESKLDDRTKRKLDHHRKRTGFLASLAGRLDRKQLEAGTITLEVKNEG